MADLHQSAQALRRLAQGPRRLRFGPVPALRARHWGRRRPRRRDASASGRIARRGGPIAALGHPQGAVPAQAFPSDHASTPATRSAQSARAQPASDRQPRFPSGGPEPPPAIRLGPAMRPRSASGWTCQASGHPAAHGRRGQAGAIPSAAPVRVRPSAWGTRCHSAKGIHGAQCKPRDRKTSPFRAGSSAVPGGRKSGQACRSASDMNRPTDHPSPRRPRGNTRPWPGWPTTSPQYSCPGDYRGPLGTRIAAAPDMPVRCAQMPLARTRKGTHAARRGQSGFRTVFHRPAAHRDARSTAARHSRRSRSWGRLSITVLREQLFHISVHPRASESVSPSARSSSIHPLPWRHALHPARNRGAPSA